MPDDPNQPVPPPSESPPSPISSESPTNPPLPAEAPAKEGQTPVDNPPSEPEPTPVSETPPAEVIPPPTQSPEPPLPSAALAQEGQPQIIEKEIIKEVPVEVIKEVIKEVPVEVIKEVIKEVPKEVIREVPVVDQNEVQRQVEEKLQERLRSQDQARRKLAYQAKAKKKEDNLNKILEYVKVKQTVTTSDIKSLLNISSSTAGKYLKELVNRGLLKKEYKGNKAQYS